MQDTSADWNLVEEVLSRLCTACNEGKLIPLLEADVVGYMHYAVVDRFRGDASRVHLSTRLYGAKQNDKYDLVIGEVRGTTEQKEALLERAGERIDAEMRRLLASPSTLMGFRPAVHGRFILEIKVFTVGFTANQNRVHLDQSIQDVGKLGDLAAICPKGRALVLFDSNGYLTDIRKGSIVKARGKDDTNLRIYICERSNSQPFRWGLL